MKYMGSKSRIAKDICPIIQSFIDKTGSNNYIECFVGGANVIDKIHCETKVGMDKNKYLIALLDYVSKGGKLLESVTREKYNSVKHNKENYPDWMVGNVGFLASYNGKFFDGGFAKPGIEHTKRGDVYRDYYQESKRNILKQANHLIGTTFIHQDFFDLDFSQYNNAVFYFDIPYFNTTKYSVDNSFDYNKFYEICREVGKNNIVIVSEEYMPEDFTCIWEKSVQRTLNPSGREYKTEKLFVIGKAVNFV